MGILDVIRPSGGEAEMGETRVSTPNEENCPYVSLDVYSTLSWVQIRDTYI